jgi:hypothetical protein
MPRDAPVTSAVFPTNSDFMFLLTNYVTQGLC